jgi:hypothetical protein
MNPELVVLVKRLRRRNPKTGEEIAALDRGQACEAGLCKCSWPAVCGRVNQWFGGERRLWACSDSSQEFRNALIGSRPAARIAGHQPKKIPINPETSTANNTDEGSTSNGQPAT